MTYPIVAILILSGCFFIFAASLGLLRFPSLFMRMHASTKAGTLGAGLLLVAVASYFSEYGITTRCLVAIVFLFTTGPVSGHAVGRAAYFSGVKLWGKSIADDLRGRYDQRTHALIDAKKKQKPSRRQPSTRF